MKEKQILFNAAMVRAILDGRKTQTRRVIKPQPIDNVSNGVWYPKRSSDKAKHYANERHFKKGVVEDFCPHGEVGDRLWVRESHYLLDLEILNIRVERLQNITEEDARLEGIVDGGCLNCGESEPCGCDNPQPDARDVFIYLWDSINKKKHPWKSNPWVWVVGFKKC